MMLRAVQPVKSRWAERQEEEDFGKQRLIEEQGAYILLSQWEKSQGPLDPMVRVAFSMADVVLEYIGANPAIFGVGGSGEKFVAGLSTNLRELLPDPERVDHWAEGGWAKFYFAERAITIFLHAGFKMIGEHPEPALEERHYQGLVRNVAMPLVEAFAKDPATRPGWVELRDTFFGPVAGAALTALAEHSREDASGRDGLSGMAEALYPTLLTSARG